MDSNQSQTGSRPNSMLHAAKRIAVSIPTTYRLIAEGKLRTYKIGRARRVTDAAIDVCIATLERETAGQPREA